MTDGRIKRQTGRQRNRWEDKKTDGKTKSQKGRQRRQEDKGIDKKAKRQTVIQSERQ